MTVPDPIPMVRCRLDGSDDLPGRTLRYIPLAEFGLWQYLMEHRHLRRVTVEEVSVWIAEQAALWNSGYVGEDLEPVLRVQFAKAGPQGEPILMERYFPAETYPEAQEALLHHSENSSCQRLSATPGYFVPAHIHQARSLVAMA